MYRPDVHFQALLTTPRLHWITLQSTTSTARTKITWKLHKNLKLTAWCPDHSANKTKLTPAVALSPCKSPDPFQGRHQKLAFVIPGSARNSGLLFLKVWPMCKSGDKLKATFRMLLVFPNRHTRTEGKNRKSVSTKAMNFGYHQILYVYMQLYNCWGWWSCKRTGRQGSNKLL